MLRIHNIKAIEILDSKGNPTIQVEVITERGSKGIASVPAGQIAGNFEAAELRDGEKSRYMGKGVQKAVENINKKIAKKLIGMNVYNQKKIDEEMILLDGTPNKSNIGANAIIGVSIAVAKAAAESLNMELYRYLGGVQAQELPTPMMSMLNGGKQSENNLNIQEFMIMPIGEITFTEKIKRGVEIYHTLKNILKQKGHSISVGDDGGFTPNLKNEEEGIEIIIEAVKKAGYELEKDVVISLDIAATEMLEEGRKIGKDGYYFWKTGIFKTKLEMIEYIVSLCKKYPIMSVEDPLSQDDWDSWEVLTKKIGDDIQLVGDNIFVTNKSRLKTGIKRIVANSISIKPNQIGTLTETLEIIYIAKRNGYKTIISHRSGETEDTIISDIAVATNIGQIKAGALSRTDRVAKYNRLLTIESIIDNN